MDADPALPTSLLADAAWVRRLARALVGDAAAAEDVAQETLLAALERPAGEPPPSRRWLAAVLRNRARLFHRARRRRDAREERAAKAEATEAGDALVVRAESLRRAVELVLALEEPYRSTVLLRYLEELPPSAIAARQGVPVATVKTRLQRALERLRRAAGAEDEGRRPAWLVALAALPEPRGAEWIAGGWIVGTKLQTVALAAAALVVLVAVGTFVMRALDAPVERFETAVDGPATVRETERAAPDEPAVDVVERSALLRTEGAAPPARAAEPDTLLTGRVVDRLDRPVAGARVEAWFDPAAGFTVLFHARPERERAARGESDADGRFALELPPGRPHELELRAEGFAPVVVPDCVAGQELRVVVERGARLRGSVVSAEDGGPTPGGGVRVFHGDWVVETPVDAQGRFALDDVVPGEVACLAIPERAAMGRYTTFEVDAGAELEVVLEVARGLTVAGRVTDARDGSPIAGALVSADRDPEKRARTDAGGRYRLEGVEPERPALLHARAPGHGGAQLVVDPARAEETDFVLAPGAAVVGRVVDSGGNPVAGAQLLAWAARHPPGIEPDRADARSADDGGFRVGPLRRDLDYELVVRAAGHALGVFPVEAAALAGGRAELGVLRLEEPALLAGRVLAPDGTGVRVLMQLDPAPGEPGAGTLVALRPFWSREDGRFALGDLAPGRFVLRAAMDGRSVLEDHALELAPGERRTGETIRLGARLTLRGAVFDPEGAPVAGARVSAVREDRDATRGLSSSAETDARGWFELEGLSAGPHRLAIAPQVATPGDVALETLLLPAVEPGATPLELVLRRLDARVRGTVVDASGEPVPLACVWIERAEPGPRDAVLCDEAGRFELAVPSGSTIELVARRTAHLSEANGHLTARELDLGRHVLPADRGEARVSGVPSGTTELVLRLVP